MKVKQINNIEIHEYKLLHKDKPYSAFQCKFKGRILARFNTLGGAEDWAKKTYDFLKPEPIKVGYKYKNNFSDKEYILAQVTANSVCLVNLETGNRMNDPVRVNNINHITPQEWNKIGGISPLHSAFTRI